MHLSFWVAHGTFWGLWRNVTLENYGTAKNGSVRVTVIEKCFFECLLTSQVWTCSCPWGYDTKNTIGTLNTETAQERETHHFEHKWPMSVLFRHSVVSFACPYTYVYIYTCSRLKCLERWVEFLRNLDAGAVSLEGTLSYTHLLAGSFAHEFEQSSQFAFLSSACESEHIFAVAIEKYCALFVFRCSFSILGRSCSVWLRPVFEWSVGDSIRFFWSGQRKVCCDAHATLQRAIRESGLLAGRRWWTTWWTRSSNRCIQCLQHKPTRTWQSRHTTLRTLSRKCCWCLRVIWSISSYFIHHGQRHFKFIARPHATFVDCGRWHVATHDTLNRRWRLPWSGRGCSWTTRPLMAKTALEWHESKVHEPT